MKTTRYTVVTETGERSEPMSHAKASKIARWLREGKTGNRKHAAPVWAKVEPVTK